MTEFLAHRANEQGGFTFNPSSNAFPTSGCAVSCFPGHEYIIERDRLLPEDIASYLKKVEVVLTQPGACLGAWKDGHRWFLDVSCVVSTREEAAGLGREHNQIAYYDLGAGETIYLTQAEQAA